MISSFVKSIPELINYKSPNQRAKEIILFKFRLEYCTFRIRGWLFTVFNCVRTGNISGLFRRAMDRIKRIG